jgi:hypothetical protein
MTCYEEILSSETEEDEFDISLRYGFNEAGEDPSPEQLAWEKQCFKRWYTEWLADKPSEEEVVAFRKSLAIRGLRNS